MCRQFAVEIIVQELFEFRQGIPVFFFPCDELAFIKTHAIAEQQVDIHRDQRFAVLVYAVLQLYAYVLKTVYDSRPFLFRDVQRLAYGIGKKGVVLYAFPEGGSPDQVRMEQQAQDRLGYIVVQVSGIYTLARGETYDRSVLLIVALTSVFDVAAFVQFQKNGIQSVVQLNMVKGFRCFPEVCDRHQGV